MGQGSGRVVAVAVAGAVGLSVWATWPLAAHLSTHVYDPSAHGGFHARAMRADIRLVHWILAWDLHALVTDPLRLFEANIFHPAATTLALSEHLLGALPIYAPLALVSGDPVFAHQATLLLTFVGAFGAAFALVWAWTGRAAAALLAGSLFAFSPFRAGHLGGLQILGCWYLPLVVLAAWRSVATHDRRAPVLLATVVALAGLHSMYLAYAMFVGVGALVAVLLATDRSAGARWRRLVVPIVMAAGLIAASAVPYVVARGGGALAGAPRAFVEATSARPGHTGASLALVIAVVTMPWWRRGLRPTVGPAWLVALGAGGILAHLFALGPTIRVAGLEVPGPYRLAAAIVPGFASLRVPLRFDAFTTTVVATLAGVGVAGVLATLATPRVRRLLTGTVGVLAVAAARFGLPHPLPLEAIETRATLPPIYDALADASPGPLLEIPWHDFVQEPRGRGAEAVRVYRSVHHWRALLNGYSGYAPPPYAVVSALVEALPAPAAVRLLARTTGLRHVLVHSAELDADARSRWEAASDALLETAARAGSDELVTLRAPPAADLLPRLRDPAGGSATLTGTPLAPLDADGRRATVRSTFDGSAALPRQRPLRLTLEVTNASPRRWPALAFDDAHRVVLAGRWERPGAGPARLEANAGRIPWDLAPGESARVVAVVRAPALPGDWRLTLGPAQDGVWFDGALSVAVRVR